MLVVEPPLSFSMKLSKVVKDSLEVAVMLCVAVTTSFKILSALVDVSLTVSAAFLSDTSTSPTRVTTWDNQVYEKVVEGVKGRREGREGVRGSEGKGREGREGVRDSEGKGRGGKGRERV